ncbi:single-stranded DNA-binding protein [Patescibacteria group bacterium]|nr:single-stranded DNA-binding protein [Patescibacteria group bacterium]
MKVEGILPGPPDMHLTTSGQAVTTFTVLDRETLTVTYVVTWDELAVMCNSSLEEESKVRVFGGKKLRWWSTPDGGKRNREELTAFRVQLLKET